MLSFLGYAAAIMTASGAYAPWENAGPLTPIRTAEGLVDPFAEGVWASRGYGWLLHIGPDRTVRYQIGDSCYALLNDADPLSAMASASYRYYRRLPGEDAAIFNLLPGDTNVVFDRLPTLPETCTTAPEASPENTADAFFDHFERHYAFFDRRPPGFADRAARVRALINPHMNESQLWEALASFMEGLSDSHTKLIGSVGGERRRVQDGQGVTLPQIRETIGESVWLSALIGHAQNALGDTAHHVGRDRILWGVIDGSVGYLQVFVMGGFTDRDDFASADWAAAEMAALNAELDAAFTAFAELDAVIVDLSNNRGGWDAVAKALPGRFTDSPFTGFTTVSRGSGLAPYPHVIQPATGPRFTGPVYLLTSNVTVSGGELATLAFRQLPNVIHAGETTRGAFSTPLPKPLPNGWLLELSNEIFASPDGMVFEETGIAPQMPLAVYVPEDPVGSHWRAVEALVAEAQAASD